MKKILLLIIMIIIITVLLPSFIIFQSNRLYLPNGSTDKFTEKTEYPKTIQVYMHKQDKIVEMDTAEYLKGVVAAEMPASFHEEALKAQAVAARSYLIAHIIKGVPESYKGAQTSTDPNVCKAWISETDRKASWDKNVAESNWEKVSNAVEQTSGVIMEYDNSPVNALFHSTSSGKTERAEDVWGGDIPYLQSVVSVGEELSPRYESENDIPLEEFKSKCEEHIANLNWDMGLIGGINRSEAGGITTIVIGGQTIKGTLLREIFSLRSTNVQIQEQDSIVKMHTLGYGHGVGMSQYGANYLATQGDGYEQILKTYYTGVSMTNSLKFFP